MYRSNFREPRVAALLGSLKGGVGPFLNFFIGAIGVEVDLGAFAGQRDDAGRADLGGLAHDVIHRATLGEGLTERDGEGERLEFLFEADLETSGAFVSGGEFANPFGAAPIEGDDGVAGGGTVDDDEVVRLLSGENKLRGFGLGRRGVDAEIGHEQSGRGPWLRVEGKKKGRPTVRPSALTDLTINYEYPKKNG